MYHRQLSEQAIISGFRKGDADIIREYFYGYCEAGYHYYDQKYQLSSKENFDMDLDMPEVMDERAILSREATMGEASMPAPTMAEPMAYEDMDFIREEVMEHQELTFLVTRIGCGIAGFTDEEISPLFEQAHGVENIVLPPNW